MMLAVPLAKLRPRQGRFGKIGIAMLAYFLYSTICWSPRVPGSRAVSCRRSSAVVGACDCVVRGAVVADARVSRRRVRGQSASRSLIHVTARALSDERHLIGYTLLVMLVLLVLSGAVSAHHGAG